MFANLTSTEKYRLAKLGIEEIPEYLRSIQNETGQDVETISFEQTALMDVVRPTAITFRKRGEKGRGDAMIELASKVDFLADTIKELADVIHESKMKFSLDVD